MSSKTETVDLDGAVVIAGGHDGHNQALDGLRGGAIIGVMLLHYTWVSVGWVGVQIFFVLSGFLITSILLRDRQLPFGSYLKRFYWRRSLRIFPLYFGYLAVFTVSFIVAGVPAAFEREWPYLYSYTFNHWFLLRDPSGSGLFFHFWSLSVEEQFYLLWPALVFLLPFRVFRGVVALLIVAGPVIRFATVGILSRASQDPVYLGQGVFSLMFCQLDAFAVGAAVAVFRERLGGHELRNFLLCSVLLLVFGQVNAIVATGSPVLNTTLGYPSYMIPNGQYIWGYTLLNVWAASLLLVAMRPNAVSAALSLPALVYVGKISYGMYVFHIVIQRGVHGWLGVRHGFENLEKFAVYFAAVVMVSSASYHWFESPFLRLKDRCFASVRSKA